MCHENGLYSDGVYRINGYTSVYHHLLTVHKIGSDGAPVLDALKRESNTISGLFNKTHMNRDMDGKQHALFTAAYVYWVIVTNLSFRQVTNSTTVGLFQMHRPRTAPLFDTSHTGIKNAVLRGYRSRLEEVRVVLYMAVSKIHISCDLWSSTNLLSLLGVVAHFLDSNNFKRTILLGVPRVLGGHDGENVAASLLDVLRRFEVEKKLGVFVMDNAYNNNTYNKDTMLRALRKSIPSIQPGDRLRCAQPRCQSRAIWRYVLIQQSYQRSRR